MSKQFQDKVDQQIKEHNSPAAGKKRLVNYMKNPSQGAEELIMKDVQTK
jgi:hypothetical protein